MESEMPTESIRWREDEGSVVLIDDHAEFLEEFSLLAKRNFPIHVITARSSIEGIEKILEIDEPESVKIIAIFVDLHMEDDFSGFRVIEKVRKDDRMGHIPIIVISQSDRQEDIAQSYIMGANSYIKKPADFSATRRVLMDALLYWTKINRPEVNPKKHDSPTRGEVRRDVAGRLTELAIFRNARAFRMRAKLNRQELARLSGVSYQMINKIENRQPVRVGHLLTVVRALEMALGTRINLDYEIDKI
jgi:two-component system, response regulator